MDTKIPIPFWSRPPDALFASLLFLPNRPEAGHRSTTTAPMAAMLFVLLLAMALPYVPPVANLLGLVPLSLGQLLTICAIVAAYLLAIEGLKHWFYRRLGHRAKRPRR